MVGRGGDRWNLVYFIDGRPTGSSLQGARLPACSVRLFGLLTAGLPAYLLAGKALPCLGLFLLPQRWDPLSVPCPACMAGIHLKKAAGWGAGRLLCCAGQLGCLAGMHEAKQAGPGPA